MELYPTNKEKLMSRSAGNENYIRIKWFLKVSFRRWNNNISWDKFGSQYLDKS